jgi:hypothetical protein
VRAIEFLIESGYNPNGLIKQYGNQLFDVFLNSVASPTNEDFDDFSDLYQVKRIYCLRLIPVR